MKRSWTETLGVIGAGRFGTALAALVAGAGRRVVLWTRSDDVAEEINERHTNEARMPGVVLPAGITATTAPDRLVSEARFLVLAVVSTQARARARLLGDYVDGSHIIVHANGALATPTDRRVSEVIREETPVRRVGALAGPALPHDLVGGRFAAMVVASQFDEVVQEGRRLLGVLPVLRVYAGRDLVGVELAASLSGAHTVAVAMADAMDIGPGPRAVMITRAVAEASRLGAAVGADARTFSGLAGLGNLLVRSTPAAQARDYAYGLALGQGDVAEGLVPSEGVHATAAAVRLADRHDVHLPLLRELDAVLRGDATPAQAAHAVGAAVVAAE